MSSGEPRSEGGRDCTGDLTGGGGGVGRGWEEEVEVGGWGGGGGGQGGKRGVRRKWGGSRWSRDQKVI